MTQTAESATAAIEAFLAIEAADDELHLNAAPTTAPGQMAPRLWHDRWAPCYRQFRVYLGGEARGLLFQDKPGHEWLASRPDGEHSEPLPSRAAALAWLMPDRPTITPKGRAARQSTRKEGTTMTRATTTAGESFAPGTPITIDAKGFTAAGIVQADGSFVDSEGKAYRTPKSWHKKVTDQYTPRLWTVGEAPGEGAGEEAFKAIVGKVAEAIATAEAPEAPAKPKRAPRKPKAPKAAAEEQEVTTEPIEDAA